MKDFTKYPKSIPDSGTLINRGYIRTAVFLRYLRGLQPAKPANFMKYCATRLFLIVFSFSLLAKISAQDKKNQTLLWRIHKGNEKPSFLFGTMHISDKKAFNFRDSLYTYLRQAEAFALEFNPDSANQIISTYMETEDDFSADEKSLDYTSPSLFDTTVAIQDTLVELVEEPVEVLPDSIDMADSTLIFDTDREGRNNLVDQFMDRIRKNQEKELVSMATFMDAYLYEMARQQHKKISGLEKLDGKRKVARAMAQGLKTRNADRLFDKWDPLGEETIVHRLYLKEDLDSIDLYYKEFFEESALEIFLFNRNKDMVKSMDSIMQGQTLFAAVGAGHLPGEKGMIALLRKMGYIVEPVFSKKRIAAETFQIDLNKRNWQTIKKEGYGFQFRLPGIPTTQEGIRGRKTIFHYDLGGGSLFMTTFGKLNSSEKGRSIHEIVTAHLDERLNEGGGRTLSKKSLVQDGYKAIEAICLYDDNRYYRYREVIKEGLFYIFTVGSNKKENLFTEKAEEYINSFKSLAIPPASWSTFKAPAEGFSILFPGKPEITDLPVEDEPEPTTTLKSYSYFDATTGANYLVSPGKALAGHEYTDGETFFTSYIAYLKEVSTAEPVFTDTSMNGYPGKIFEGKTSSTWFRGFVVRRSNTSYYIIAEYEDSIACYADAEKFLRSFRMTAFTQPTWSFQSAPGNDFKAWLPGQIVQKKQDSTDYNFKPGELHFYGHDPFAATSYNVEVYPISKYFWSPNLDSVYNHWKDKVVNNWSDSLVSYSDIKIRNQEGREICKINKASNDRTRLRLLLNGNTMYVLTAESPYAHADEKNARLFFEEFRLTREKSPSTILENEPHLLFADLQSKDSTQFRQAYTALDEVQFLEKDIMLLMEKAILQYPTYESDYVTVNEQLLQKTSELFNKSDSVAFRKKVINFIKDHYKSENKAIDSVRFYWLGIIASDKTYESYRLLGELLANNKTATDYNHRLFGKLYDSLALTSTLYPGFLDYIRDTTVGLAIVTLTKTLIDSNLLKTDVLQPIKKSLQVMAKEQILKMTRENFDEAYHVPDLIELLAYFRQKDADDMIAGFLKVKDNWIKKAATLALVKNKKAVPSLVFRTIADDLQHRAEFYIALEKLQKQKLFPADHRSQEAMAESYIFTAVFDEEEDYTKPELIFIKKVEYEYKGARKVFYIFRANYNYENSEEADNEEAEIKPESYFTVAGPFELDESILTIDEKENISGMWYQEKFDGMKNDYFFRKYIEQRLKWQNEK